MNERFTPLNPDTHTPKSANQYEPTGESISAHFRDLPTAANDERPYDRRKKPADEQTATKSPEREPSKYLAIALSPDGGLEAAIEAGKHDAIEKLFIKEGFLVSEDGKLFLSDKRNFTSLRGEQKQTGDIKTYPQKKWYAPKDLRETFGMSDNKFNITAEDFFSYLDNLMVYEPASDEPLPLTTLPTSFSEVASGMYPPCHIKPWEIPLFKRNLWDQPIALEDGTETNLAELQTTVLLRELQLESETIGRFLITDPDTGEKKSIVGNELAEKYLPTYGSSSSLYNSRGRTADFVQQYFKNLDRTGILRATHFRKTSGGFEDSIVAPSDRQLSKGTPDVSLRTPNGRSLKYYLGREKIVGTDIPYTRENMVLRYLDNRTIGIVRIDKNFEEILCTFPLVSPEEVEERRTQTKNRLLADNQSATEQDLSNKTFVGGTEMKQRMRLYKVSDHLPPFPGEDPRAYADRVARLSDTRLISKDAREFFQRANIGIHQLPWSEQLAASSILLDPRFKKDEVAAFCQRYGVDGLRTFIASSFGSNINKDILDLGKKSPELAQTTFEKFREILAAVDGAKELVQSLSLKNYVHAKDWDSTLFTVENQLLKRAKLLLEEIVATTSQAKKLSPESVGMLSQKLETVRSDIILFTATFKTLREDGHEISMSDFQDSSFPNVHGSELPETEVALMRSLYADSMQGYPEKTKEELLADFDTHTQDEKSMFSLLRYKGEIAGFLCFTEDEEKPGQKYVSAVTLDPRFQKAYIGETMIDEAFAREAESNILGADCVAQKSVSARYIENGFIGIHSWDDKGDLIMDIVRDDRRNEKYFSTKSLSQEEIVKLAPLGKIGTAQVEVLNDPKEHSFALCNEGFFLTRYFKDKSSGKWYLVYEPKPTKAPSAETVVAEEEALA